jgi:hypothetical protein
MMFLMDELGYSPLISLRLLDVWALPLRWLGRAPELLCLSSGTGGPTNSLWNASSRARNPRRAGGAECHLSRHCELALWGVGSQLGGVTGRRWSAEERHLAVVEQRPARGN